MLRFVSDTVGVTVTVVVTVAVVVSHACNPKANAHKKPQVGSRQHELITWVRLVSFSNL